MQLTNRQKVVLTVFLVVLITAGLLLFAEGAVRARQWLKYGTFGHLGMMYTEDQAHDGLRVPAAGTKTRSIQFNSLGFRGPEIPVERPVERLRIAFLGASTTFCAEVSSNEMTWPHLVIERLRQAFPNKQIDYVNGAVPGYTVQSSLANLRKRVASLDPQVIFVYHATNDFSVETRRIAAGQGLYEAGSEKAKHWLSEHSLLWYLVQKNWEVMRTKESSKKNFPVSAEYTKAPRCWQN